MTKNLPQRYYGFMPDGTLVLVVHRATGTKECAEFVGRVFVDDVYSDGELYQRRRGRYPLLSEAIKGGLYHYGCKCWHVSFFEGATDTNSHGEQIPSFVDSNTADQMQTQHQDAEYHDTELREQRMQNFAMLVEAATLAREAEMGTTVNLGEWFENSLRYIQERYSNVYGSLGKKPGTNIIIVRLSANGVHGTAEFRDGVDGTRIDRDGNIFVNPQVLWNAFGRVIDPPITHTPVADSIRFGLGVGAVRGVGRVVNWLDRIANNAGRTSEFAGRPFVGTRNPDADFSNGKRLESHFQRHGRSHFGHTDEQAYLRAARNFLEKRPTSTTQSFVSRDGWYFRYDTRTNEFGIINEFGGISTYFKPKDGLIYWLEQIAKYAFR